MGKVTRIAILLDTSGSMDTIKRPALDAFNAINQTIKEKAAAGEKTIVSLWTFGERVTEKFLDQDASILRFIKDSEYRTIESYTKLNDALVVATKHLHASMDLMNNEEACLVIAVTDGGENCSNNTFEQVRSLVQGRQATGAWTYVIQVPPGHKQRVVERYGFHEGNVREWESTRQGAQEMGESTSSGLTTYYQARKAGKRSTQTFFANLSQATEEEVKAMPDVSNRFKTAHVEKGEVEIQPFIEAKFGTYIAGSGYFQLTKTELVRPDREVIVRKRGERKLYGGKDGRRLLGLPDNGDDVRLKMGNLGDYEVFIQSGSHNRKLVRGTTMLWDHTRTVPIEKTWTPVEPEQQQAKPVAVVNPAPATSKSSTWPPRRSNYSTNQQKPAVTHVQTSSSGVNRTELVKRQTRDAKGRFGAKKRV